MSDKSAIDKPTEIRGLRRRVLLRDAVVFQGKLLMDAGKDLLLGPASVGAAILDFLFPRPRRRMRFYTVLKAGRRAERSINLFGTTDADGVQDHWTVDDVLREVESGVLEQYRSGGVSAAAKQAMERTLRSIRNPEEGRR